MSEFESYSKELLLSAKLYLQDASLSGIATFERNRFLRSSITHAFFFLEAELNYLSSHFKDNRDFDLIERSILSERELALEKGEFKLTNREKFYRIEDKIEFLIVRFSGSRELLKEKWNADLAGSVKLRNRLVHPREPHDISLLEAETCITAVIHCLSALYRAIFQRDFPLLSLGLDTGPINAE